MFATGNHLILYVAVGAYVVALALYYIRIRESALAFLLFGVIFHILYLVGRGWLGGTFVANPMFEGPYILPCAIATITLFSALLDHDRDWGPLLLPVLLASAFALAYPRGMIPPTPKKVTFLANIFFFTEVTAHALFYSGALLAFKSLLVRKDTSSYHGYLVWGFVVFSIAQVSGALWCYLGWGNTFRWSSRHMMSAAIWLYYAAYLHLRFLSEWDAKKKAVFAAVGAAVVFVGSFLSNLHEMHFPRVGG
ncbi:MAG TPA: cytochrome c biogenesis protein CcsA [Spirochaetota bacterium]|nr:cytochrome c biogenesis protein CcsA [Spirochaetota bacterium]HPI90910.1 cytochrome c biogenesis protein CcsA [Spirochaetota bacterium]HPR50007.1 cytochrome c biogenesis protein CcsA [Spirochaetota bacterium]